MFYPHPHPYEWDWFYHRFLTGKLDLADRRLNARWRDLDLLLQPELVHRLDTMDDNLAEDICAIHNLGVHHRYRHSGQPHLREYSCVIYDHAIHDLPTIARLDRERRAFRTAFPIVNHCAAVAVMPTVTPEELSEMRQYRVHILTCQGLHTPGDAPIPPRHRYRPSSLQQLIAATAASTP